MLCKNLKQKKAQNRVVVVEEKGKESMERGNPREEDKDLSKESQVVMVNNMEYY